MSARKIGFLILLLGFGAVVETSWGIREYNVSIGPEGCRVLGGRFYGPSFAFEESIERMLPEGGAPEVEVENAFGGVRIEAVAGSTIRIGLRKVVYLPTEDRARAFADRIELGVDQDGPRLSVGTNRDALTRERDVGFETHLELRVPPETAVIVRNEHGVVAANGVSRATIRASFDDVRVEGVGGPVEVEARHGAVRVGEVGGELTMKVRHGDVEVSDLRGAADLDVEHGRVTAHRTATLTVNGSFGDVTAETVGGDLVVRSRHGAVTASDVTGRADVETTFAAIRLTGIGGDTRAKTRHAEVRARDVAGRLVVETSHGEVNLEHVGGPVEVSVERGGVEARSLDAGGRLHAVGGDVAIDGFRGPVDVSVERATVRLAPGAPITEAVTADVTGGGVHLEAPTGSRFELEVESRRGALHLDVPGLATVVQDPERRGRATGTLGGGGARVRLVADGDVTIEPGPAATTPEAP